MKHFYHATNEVFDRFDPDRPRNGATNGCLGVWVGHSRSKCEMFGDVLMTLTVPEVVTYELSYEDLKEMHDASAYMEDSGVAYYRGFARSLVDEGFSVIDIVENSGVHHSILIDLDSIIVLDHEMSARAERSWGR